MSHERKANGILVCIVEDEPLLRLDAVDLIEQAGYSTVEAGNADEAVEILQGRDDIRIVITDIDMPGTMNGLKLANVIRDRWPPIDLIVVSGAVVPTAEQMPKRGHFLAKPFAPQELIRIVEKFAA